MACKPNKTKIWVTIFFTQSRMLMMKKVTEGDQEKVGGRGEANFRLFFDKI